MRDRDENEGTEFRGSGRLDDDELIDQEAVNRALQMERDVHPAETEEGLTQRLFRENAASVAMQMVHIATRGTSERIRLDAGKYIIDRVLGPVGKQNETGDGPLDQMVRQMQRDAEIAANQAYNS
jgi:hypothetical protein